MRTIAGVAVLLALLGACAGGDAASPSAARVNVRDFAFGPREIRVKSGGTVTWTNRDDFDHAVQIDALGLDGPHFGPQTSPATYAHRFSKAGTYAYVCSIHNSMTGTVIVTD
jgi:plastocyanin